MRGGGRVWQYRLKSTSPCPPPHVTVGYTIYERLLYIFLSPLLFRFGRDDPPGRLYDGIGHGADAMECTTIRRNRYYFARRGNLKAEGVLRFMCNISY